MVHSQVLQKLEVLITNTKGGILCIISTWRINHVKEWNRTSYDRENICMPTYIGKFLK